MSMLQLRKASSNRLRTILLIAGLALLETYAVMFHPDQEQLGRTLGTSRSRVGTFDSGKRRP
jgi:hypothetical protein